MKKITAIVLMLVIALLQPLQVEGQRAEAAVGYMKVEAFIKYIVTEMKWEVDQSAKQPYIDAAIEKGILKEGDFKSYNSYLTRTDCAVIANRLDELVNLYYGYSKDVYEFLKDCIYYEGRLYYIIKNSLYPAGVTKETYTPNDFLEKKIIPVLGNAFSNDNWVKYGLRAGYDYTYDSNDSIKEQYIEFGVKPTNPNNFVGIDTFNEDSKIVKAWNAIHDGDRRVDIVLEKRISDIIKITSSKRKAVASIVAKGIIKGYSNGMYIQNRSFKGSSKITASGAKDVIKKVLNPKKRASISPDGQLIRTTKLPKNANKFPYILECFPNEFYEMRFEFVYFDDWKKGTLDKSWYTYPKETTYDYLYDNYYKGHMSFGMDKYEYYDIAISRAEEFINYAFNVDYRTVDQKWIKKLNSTFAQHADSRIYGSIERYVEAMKENHVVVESKQIAVEPSIIYYKYDLLLVRVYVKYRITADDITAGKLVYGSNSFIGLKNGKWRYGYYDIELLGSDLGESGNHQHWGVDTIVGFNDWAFLGND